jgi:hypothetical protein
MHRTLFYTKIAMKLNYSPFLLKIAADFKLSPGDIHKALEKVVPGGISRRAVGYWLADPSDASSRRCDSYWISLLLMSLQMEGKLKKSEVVHNLKAMEAISDFVSFDKKAKRKNKASANALSSDHMSLLQQVLDRSERRRNILGHEPLKGNPFPFDPGKAHSSVPGY